MPPRKAAKKAAPKTERVVIEKTTPALTRIKLKRNLFSPDGKRVKGEIVEVSDKFARRFVSAGGAEFVDD